MVCNYDGTILEPEGPYKIIWESSCQIQKEKKKIPVGKMNELANGINNTAQGAILCSWFHTR